MNAGAKWRVDGGPWKNSGQTVNNLSNATHTVEFRAVSGWLTPAAVNVQIVSGANKPAFENVANLDRLPEQGATLIALPMKIGGGSGGPARIVAVLP